MKSKKFEYLDIIIDNPNSWMWQFINQLEDILGNYSRNIRIFKSAKDIEKGDILFILSCDRILKENDLSKHDTNIVIHASDLPKGRGWSPWSWDVENGSEKIILTLFEAVLELDAGDWYLKDHIKLQGTELIDEIRELLAKKEFEMINEFLNKYPMSSKEQVGTVTFNEKRTSKNQELNINYSINEQFNKLRVCDNENYPAYFYKNGKKFILKIFEDK